MERIWTFREFAKNSRTGFFDYRANTKLIAIEHLLKLYYTTHELEVVEQQLLVGLVDACDNYINSKAIKKSKRTPAVLELKDQVIRRLSEKAIAQQKWQMLRDSPIFKGKGKMLDQRYWRETIGPHFAGGDFTQNAFAEWESSRSSKNFADWLDSIYIPRILAGPSSPMQSVATKIQSTKVEYLNDEERKNKLITIQNGLFIDAFGQPCDTGTMSTVYSGNGWGIFVIDTDKNIYISSHKMAEFHHSSFLSGAAVFAAGEMAIRQGRLVSISGKSGHYKPGPEILQKTLFLLHYNGIDLSSATAIIDIKKPVRYFNAYEVMLNDSSSTGLVEVAAPNITALVASAPTRIPYVNEFNNPSMQPTRPAPLPPVAKLPPTRSPYVNEFNNPSMQPVRPAPLPPVKVAPNIGGYLQPINSKPKTTIVKFISRSRNLPSG
mgnify:FL=1